MSSNPANAPAIPQNDAAAASAHPAEAADPAAFTRQDFRAALGRFATGVTIVTTRAADGTPVGLTANSFNSVSLTPPLVLWSLATRATTLAAFSTASHYAIHILDASQRELAERFATSGIDRFAGLDWQAGEGGVPLLDGAATTLQCHNRSRYEEGDHLIFVGEVVRCDYRADASPLIYHGGRFYTELPM